MEWQAGPSSINGSRAYWIQGRQGSHWSNVETLSDVQSAIDRLGRLVAGNRYDELRLIEARISAISGKAVYTELLIVRDGEVIDPMRAEPVGPALSYNLAPAHPELPLWTEESSDSSTAKSTQPGLFPGVAADMPAPDELEWIAAPRRRTMSVVVPPPVATPQQAPAAPAADNTDAIAEDEPPLQLEDQIDTAPPPVAEDEAATIPAAEPARSDAAAKTLTDFAEWMRSRPVYSPASAQPEAKAATAPEAGTEPDEAGIVSENAQPAAEDAATPEEAKPAPARTSEGAPAAEREVIRPESVFTRPEDAYAPREWAVEAPLEWEDDQEDQQQQARPTRRLGSAGERDRFADFDSPFNRPARPDGPARTRRGGIGRGAVLSGLFVAAVAAGVGIAALDPATSARLSAALFGELPLIGADSRLAAAINANDPDAVRAAILAGADPNGRPSGDVPALLLAARSDSDQAFHALLESGADPARMVEPGRSVMHVMAAEDLTASLSASLDSGVSVDVAGGTQGCVTPLMSAAAQGKAAAAKLLAERGAKLDPRPGCDVGPLDAARLHPELEQALRDMQAERTAPAGATELATASAAPAAPVAPKAEPFTIVERQAMLREPTRLGEFLAQAIDRRDMETLRFLMANRPVEMPLDTVGLFAQDMWGMGFRSPVDYAILAGNLDAARMLLGAGAVPSARIIHMAVDARSHPGLNGAAELLLGNGADPNAVYDGLTPLMRAALKGDWDGVQLLLAYGADASLTTAQGQSAADFAAQFGDTDLQEMLTLRAQERQYSDLMMGLSWFDTLASINPPTEACSTRQPGYLTCSLDRTIWLNDAIRVEGHFDLSAGNRLVAIEVFGAPISNEKAARDRFAQVASEIQAHLPEAHRAFSVETMPQDPNVPFLEAIRPEVAAASWYRYWSDDNKTRPAFLHLSLVGVEGAKAAQWRLVIGNPFRSN